MTVTATEANTWRQGGSQDGANLVRLVKQVFWLQTIPGCLVAGCLSERQAGF